MRYAYYPGCSLHSSAKEYDLSARAVCGALDISLEEIPGWVCCGASSAHMTSELLALALPVRNLLAAETQHLDVVTCCAACYSRLRVANHVMASDADKAARVAQVVGSPYDGQVRVTHLLEVLSDSAHLEAIGERAGSSLHGLKVASYYGCLLVRPPMLGMDDPDNPTTMDRLMATLGAEPIDWPHKTECCGGSLSLTRTDVVLELCAKILQTAVDEGADCVAVACPLCQANLDMRQEQINAAYGLRLNLPILYFTQLIGIAGIGASDPTARRKALGLDRLIVSPDRLLRDLART